MKWKFIRRYRCPIIKKWKAEGHCSRGDKCLRHDEDKRAKPTPKTAPPSEPPTQRGGSASRTTNLGGQSPSGKFARQPCAEISWKIFAPNQKFVISARLHTSGLKVNPAKNRQRMVTEARWLFFLRCTTIGLRVSGHRTATIFIDFTEEHESLGINPTSVDSHKLCSVTHPRKQRSVARKKSSQSSSSAQSYALIFEGRSQEETEWQEQGAREAAWKRAKIVLQLKKYNRATFFSPSDKKVLACINP